MAGRQQSTNIPEIVCSLSYLFQIRMARFSGPNAGCEITAITMSRQVPEASHSALIEFARLAKTPGVEMSYVRLLQVLAAVKPTHRIRPTAESTMSRM
jgi:hypothetical protein